jgi:ApbE superfamily uncharacterized protein (UPF0280 family)
MTAAQATLLPCGRRLHLQHGPIDLIVEADQNRDIAYSAAKDRFETILEELVSELPDLRKEITSGTARPHGEIASRMYKAAHPHCHDVFITPMIAVAGAVADTVLDAMKLATPLKRAYVNNGGDIALYLEDGQYYEASIHSYDGRGIGRITIGSEDNISGIATSGRHGRSFSLGIADSATILAESAAMADASATLVANAVDLPGHPLISRTPAHMLDPDSDLGDKLIVTDCGLLSSKDQHKAISQGEIKAYQFFNMGLIKAAAIFLQNENRLIGHQNLALSERTFEYA